MLALERRPQDAPPVASGLSPTAAAVLAEKVAADLTRLFPGVEALDLALVAILFDPAQLLRPGWPLDAALNELQVRAPRNAVLEGSGRLLAFGCSAEGYPGAALTPDPQLDYGPLLLLPLQLSGAADLLDDFSGRIEASLFDLGMAGAVTALNAQDAFGVQLEHARYLMRHDLCAMTAMQYEHAGIGALWPLIESALFDSSPDITLDAADLPPLRLHGSQLLLGELSPADLQRRVEQLFDDDGRRHAAVKRWPQRCAQIEAVLRAHGLAVQRVPLESGQTLEAIGIV